MSEVKRITENKWLINLKAGMEKRLRRGETRYVQAYKERPAYNEPSEDAYRYLTLVKCYPRYALFSHSSLWGKTFECLPYDVIRETVSES